MSAKKQEPELSDAEKAKDLARRQKGHVFMTGVEVEQARSAAGLRPLKERHWMVRAEEANRLEQIRSERQRRLRFLASGWKRLATNKSNAIYGLLSGLVVD